MNATQTKGSYEMKKENRIYVAGYMKNKPCDCCGGNSLPMSSLTTGHFCRLCAGKPWLAIWLGVALSEIREKSE